MLKIDKAISDTNAVICDNIARFSVSERGLLSQNILAQLRNFVEYVAIKLFSENEAKDLDPSIYDNHKISLKYIEGCGHLYFIRDFHKMLQRSVSHYTVDKDKSERLMIKYCESLLRIKHYLKEKYNIEVLENIDQFPLYMDTELFDYYKKNCRKNSISKRTQKIYCIQ